MTETAKRMGTSGASLGKRRHWLVHFNSQSLILDSRQSCLRAAAVGRRAGTKTTHVLGVNTLLLSLMVSCVSACKDPDLADITDHRIILGRRKRSEACGPFAIQADRGSALCSTPTRQVVTMNLTGVQSPLLKAKSIPSACHAVDSSGHGEHGGRRGSSHQGAWKAAKPSN
ncbi:hypothetical protein J7T55_006663 [Diaporthe amygdali]|uniref:uncharacterized protein n=1 Tax=Phomopsis amygdali TaxID=1214568 RepID=UPI0022FEB82F|nr:uncharacterized protein J7T55_006663 [Diaporthe amygdali]KAJ0125317.1 hypothetical protein J7T55_006663 [Diaporthe amygdali]